ncbi:MAG: hypothetical protein ACR2N7_00410 [Acidimicrobiia bacterium]
MKRVLLATAGLLLVLAACGGSAGADRYVEGLNDLVATTAPDLEASLAEYEQISDPTMEDWAVFIEREVAIRRVFGEGFDALDPPGEIAEVHRLLGDAVDRGLVATEALTAIAASASSPEEAQDTPEFAEYQAANADGSSRVCLEAVAKLDELAASGEEFADQPWVSNLGVTVRVAFGCVQAESG